MKHKIRINGEVKEIDCELGSSILDKHGREIIEHDTVINEWNNIFNVWFKNGQFWLVSLYDHNGDNYRLDSDKGASLEIIGC